MSWSSRVKEKKWYEDCTMVGCAHFLDSGAFIGLYFCRIRF